MLIRFLYLEDADVLVVFFHAYIAMLPAWTATRDRCRGLGGHELPAFLQQRTILVQISPQPHLGYIETGGCGKQIYLYTVRLLGPVQSLIAD